MRKVIIVGAGPIGLLLAILLKQLGINDIEVIDPKANKYIRPGYINKKTFTLLSLLVGKLSKQSASNHIKDIERSLYEIAKSLNITITNAEFVGLEEKAIRIRIGDSNKTLPCDLVIDASGEQKAVINAINKLEPDSFTIRHISDSTSKNRHLIAYVKVSDEDLVYLNGNNSQSSISYFNKFEQLRAMGWKGFIEPIFTAHILKKNKVCFYVELPDDLEESEYELWLQKVVALKTDKEDFTFQQIPSSSESQYNKKNVRFNAFTLSPYIVNEAYHLSEKLPCIIPVGDARMSSIYLKGSGIKNASKIVMNLVNAINLDKKTKDFSIDFGAYERLSSKVVKEHEDVITNFFSAKRKLHENIAEIYYQQAIDKLKAALDADNCLQFDNHGYLKFETEIGESTILFQKALYSANENLELANLILKEIEEIAALYKSLGLHYFSQTNYGASKRYYNVALNLLSGYLKDSKLEDITDINIRLIDILCKEKNFTLAYVTVISIQEDIQSYDMVDKDKFEARLKYYETFSSLNMILTSSFSVDAENDVREMCEENILELMVDGHLQPSKITVLQQLLNRVNRNLEQQFGNSLLR